MCTRFFIDRSNEELDEIISAAACTKTADMFCHDCFPMVTHGEVKPTDVAPVIAPSASGKPTVYAMKWGYHRTDRPDPILNARTETAAIRPTFKVDWSRHRCIVPASYYFEWEHMTDPKGRKKAGSKYLIQPKGYSVTWLCGLYHIEDGLPCFVILTREPDTSVMHIHDRMPLILPKEKIGEWIDPNGRPDITLRYALTDMISEKTG